MKTIKDLGVSNDNSVFIIAEIGINHGGNVDLAKDLIKSAARAGADSVKFQTYITEKRVPIHSPIFEILKKCELSFESFIELKKFSEECGVLFFSTPFDEESVDFLESIDSPMYKIASFDLVNRNLLKKVAGTGKPVIMSTGMSDLNEISRSLDILRKDTNKIGLLHCVSAYPTEEKDANLGAITSLLMNFEDVVIGQSDHTNDIRIPTLAVAAGAKIIEKHFKISDTMECVDAPVSISEHKFSLLVNEIRSIEKILGSGIPKSTAVQKPTEQYRRFS